MPISLRGELARGRSTASGSVPGSPAGVAAFQNYSDGSVPPTNDPIVYYWNAPGGGPFDGLTFATLALNAPLGINDGLGAVAKRARVNAGDTLSGTAWAWAAVAFSGFRAFQSSSGPDWDQLLPYDAQHWDGRPLESGLHTRVFRPMPVKAADTLALLFVAYSGPATAGKINNPVGWTELPEVTGGAPGETQRTVAAFYRVLDCSTATVGATLVLQPAGAGARYYTSLILCGLVVTHGLSSDISPDLCTLPAAEPAVAMPVEGTNRGWYSVDFAFLPGKAIASLACPSAANDNYGRLWHIRWSGDYPPVPAAPVEIISEGVVGAGLLAMTDARQYAFYTLAASPNRLRYRKSTDGGRTWEAEVEIIDGGGLGSALGSSRPSEDNAAPPVLLLPNGRLVVGSRLLQYDEGTGEWTFLIALANAEPPEAVSQTLADSGETLQLLRDRSVMRARSGGTLLRARAFQDDGTFESDLRTPSPGFPAPPANLDFHTVAWINERTGILLTLRQNFGSPGSNPVFLPSHYSWRVYKLNSDERYEFIGNSDSFGGYGLASPHNSVGYFVWDPVLLAPYGGSFGSYNNGCCRLRIDAAGLWWLLRARPNGDLHFARGRNLADHATMFWEGRLG